ncbi:hypothetical protein OH77DRAFT_1419626 [Trametes cingulata]|nr:hypothetical protein OH77DRAFT_1419626 [Trametes cingulata]
MLRRAARWPRKLWPEALCGLGRLRSGQRRVESGLGGASAFAWHDGGSVEVGVGPRGLSCRIGW